MPFRETTPPPDLPTEQVPLEVYVAAKRAHITALRKRAGLLQAKIEHASSIGVDHNDREEPEILRAEAQVLEYDLQNFLFTVKQHQLAEEAVKHQQQQQIITANLRPKPGRMI